MKQNIEKIYNLVLLDIDSIKLEKLSQYDFIKFEEMVSYLSEYYELVVSSNNDFKETYDKASFLNIKNYLSHIAISSIPKFDKCKPYYYSDILHQIYYSDVNKVLLLGHDLNNEILGAIRYGIDNCLISNECNSFDGIIPTYEAKSYEKVKSLF